MKHTLFLFFLLGTFSLLAAQDSQQDFLITLTQDTLFGKWEEHYTTNEGLRIKFTQDNVEKWYTAEEINAYGRGKNYLRKAQQVKIISFKNNEINWEMVFMECLIKGDISLFSYNEGPDGRSLFISFPSGEIKSIYSEKEVIYIGEKQYTTKGKQYLPVMKQFMGACYDPEDKLRNYGFSRKRVIAVIKDYHRCKNKDYDSYNLARAQPSYLGIQVGYRPGFSWGLPSSGDLAYLNPTFSERLEFGVVFRSFFTQNPSIFFQFSLDYNIQNRNQHELILHPKNTSGLLFTETHNLIPRVSLGKTFIFPKSYFSTQAGFFPGWFDYQSFKIENKLQYYLSLGLFLDLGYGLNLGNNLKAELYVNALPVKGTLISGIRIFRKIQT